MKWKSKRGVADKIPEAPIRRTGTEFKEIKVGNMVTTIERVNMFKKETTTATTTSTGVTIVTNMIGVGPMFHLKIEKLILGMVEVVWHELRICYRRWWGGLMLVMNTPRIEKSLREPRGKGGYTCGLDQDLELEMDQLSTTMNPCQSGTLPSNIV